MCKLAQLLLPDYRNNTHQLINFMRSTSEPYLSLCLLFYPYLSRIYFPWQGCVWFLRYPSMCPAPSCPDSGTHVTLTTSGKQFKNSSPWTPAFQAKAQKLCVIPYLGNDRYCFPSLSSFVQLLYRICRGLLPIPIGKIKLENLDKQGPQLVSSTVLCLILFPTSFGCLAGICSSFIQTHIFLECLLCARYNFRC